VVGAVQPVSLDSAAVGTHGLTSKLGSSYTPQPITSAFATGTLYH